MKTSILTSMALATAFTGLFGLTIWAQESKTPRSAPPRENMNHAKVMEECAKACTDCQRECDSCAAHCVRMLVDGKKDHSISLRNCQDCAAVCATAAQIVSRSGPMYHVICDACAESCKLCAKECAAFPNDEHMKKCAEECRKCEKACRDMGDHKTAK